MSTTEPWFIEHRAEALTLVLLTRRSDLIVTPLRDHDQGLAMRVEIAPERRATGRIFGIQIGAQVAALPTNTQTSHPDQDTVTSIAPTFPVCGFFCTMEDNQAYYRWVLEPVVADQQPHLRWGRSEQLVPLNSAALDQIIAQTNAWYDQLAQNVLRG